MEVTETDSALKGSVRLGNYLRRLRTGYGYSLRRVEERARADGGEIDNSQLSRYEKGICYPSFDKLRILANVFNVSVQAFSDVVDLEAYEDLKPAEGDPVRLVDAGNAAMQSGDFGRAFAHYERAVEVLLDHPDLEHRDELLAQARLNLAMSLIRLGKLSLAEQELRQSLRASDRLSPALTVRAILSLSNLHADQGDLVLAEIEAERAHRDAMAQGLVLQGARAVHTLARVLALRRQFATAIERYREASELYLRSGEEYEALRVRINVGDCFVALGKVREGIRLLKAALAEARQRAHRRLEAQAWSNLGEAHYRLGEASQSQACFRQSDSLAGGGAEKYPDLLFFNAFYDWKMAIEQGNPTREKIAFGRMKMLRSGIERRIPEVDEFDAFIERGRIHA